ncbi:MAG: hypothetical protein ACOZQL_08570 [Myxococcota bacterium]
MSHLRFAIALTVVFTVLVFASCGAENLVAPAAEKRADIQQCRGFEQLMPNFLEAINQGKTENLKNLVETQLLVSERADQPPAVNEVLRAIFKTMTTFAMKPKEPNAPADEYCAPISNPPPLSSANELCEMRRALQLLVHEGKGIDAIQLIEPQTMQVLNYVTGDGLDCKGRPRAAHYEVAGLISEFCTQTANCQLTDGLDMAIAFTDYVNTADGRAMVQHLNELAKKDSITGMLNPQSLTEADTVTLSRALITAIQGADADGVRNAFNLLPQQTRMDLQPVVDDLVKILGHPELMGPIRRSLNCLTTEDRNNDLVRMIYRLAIEEQCPEFGLTRLTNAIQGVQDVDQRGSIIFIVNVLAKAIRSDDLAIDSSAKVCRTVFSTAKAPGQARSNAELALPAVADLVQVGVINEAICAMDTLIFGCAGGEQPACR